MSENTTKAGGGVWAAIPTAFQENGELDWQATQGLVETLLKGGVDGLVVAGTTGEASSLTDKEFSALVENAVSWIDGQVPVAVGTGSASTKKTIENTLKVKRMGVDIALVVTPYYVKPSQNGLRRHYAEVYDQAQVPLFLYNVPSRTAVNLLPETALEIAQNADVFGLKECGPLEQGSRSIEILGDKMIVMTGDDPVFLDFMQLGGDGIVSVAANIALARMKESMALLTSGQIGKAREHFATLAPLNRALFREGNPVPLKMALSLLREDFSARVRAPLAIAANETAGLLKLALNDLGLS